MVELCAGAGGVAGPPARAVQHEEEPGEHEHGRYDAEERPGADQHWRG
jgi:hypothetical protein